MFYTHFFFALAFVAPFGVDEAGKPLPTPVVPSHIDLCRGGGMTGLVTAIDGTSITVRGNNVVYPAGGVTIRFLFTEGLTKGQAAPETSPGHRYLPPDVKVGDEVNLTGDRTKGIWICTHISITRRPGDRVPKAHGEEEIRYGFRHSEYMNALQDLEEKGIPLPAKFNPPPVIVPPELRRPPGPNPVPALPVPEPLQSGIPISTPQRLP